MTDEWRHCVRKRGNVDNRYQKNSKIIYILSLLCIIYINNLVKFLGSIQSSPSSRDCRQTIMSSVLRCLFGPRLLRLNLKAGAQAVDYQPLALERWGDTVISSVNVTAKLLLYVSPIVIPWAINKAGLIRIYKWYQLLFLLSLIDVINCIV